MPRRADSPYVFTAPCGRRFSKTSHYYYWRLLRTEAGRRKDGVLRASALLRDAPT